MWDIRCDLVDATEHPLLKQFKCFIRRRNDTDLFRLALRLIAVQQVHELQHEKLYQKPIRDKMGAVNAMAATANKISMIQQIQFTESDVGSSSSNSFDMQTESSNNEGTDGITLQPEQLTQLEIGRLTSSDNSASSISQSQSLVSQQSNSYMITIIIYIAYDLITNNV